MLRRVGRMLYRPCPRSLLLSPIRVKPVRTLGKILTTQRQCSSSSSSRIDIYSDATTGDDLDNDEKEDVSSLVDRYLHSASLGHQVLIIQPYIKAGPQRKVETTAQLMVAESRALAETLDWKVVDVIALGLTSFRKKYLFGTGNLEMLRARVAANVKITAVFVSMYQLTAVQRLELETLFQVPVIDRYHLVLQIFFQHASSKEARLQVALAEIPYLKNRLIVEYEIEKNCKSTGGNLGEQHFVKQRFVLKKLENSIKKKISALKQQRDKLRDGRKKRDVPTVAVIGYTNCGKTSLIKALTDSSQLQPMDKLFATLDVTCHRTVLPGSNLEVVFIDTVGFISDIPTPLVASFSSTLEDALQADLLIHVRDFSNPDNVNQNSQVLSTLNRLAVGQAALDTMITVGNKIDLVPAEQWPGVLAAGCLPASATQGLGLDRLASRLTPPLLEARGLLPLTVRLRPASEDWHWLRSHATISGVETCPEDQNFYLVRALLTQANLDRLRARLASE